MSSRPSSSRERKTGRMARKSIKFIALKKNIYYYIHIKNINSTENNFDYDFFVTFYFSMTFGWFLIRPDPEPKHCRRHLLSMFYFVNDFSSSLYSF